MYTLKGKLKRNELVKALLKLVHIHSPALHKSLSDSGKSVLFVSHSVIDWDNRVCVCTSNSTAIWPAAVVRFHRL